MVRGRVSLVQRKAGVTAEQQQPTVAGQPPPPMEEEEQQQGSDDEGWVVVQRLKAGQHFLPSEHSPSTGSGDWLIRVESAEVRAAARASCARPAWPASLKKEDLSHSSHNPNQPYGLPSRRLPV